MKRLPVSCARMRVCARMQVCVQVCVGVSMRVTDRERNSFKRAA